MRERREREKERDVGGLGRTCRAPATVRRAAGLVFIRARMRSLASLDTSVHSAGGSRSTT